MGSKRNEPAPEPGAGRFGSTVEAHLDETGPVGVSFHAITPPGERSNMPDKPGCAACGARAVREECPGSTVSRQRLRKRRRTMRLLADWLIGWPERVSRHLMWLAPLFARITVGWVFLLSGWGKLNNLPQVTENFIGWGIPF